MFGAWTYWGRRGHVFPKNIRACMTGELTSIPGSAEFRAIQIPVASSTAPTVAAQAASGLIDRPVTSTKITTARDHRASRVVATGPARAAARRGSLTALVRVCAQIFNDGPLRVRASRGSAR
jgi:hypothetical protein